VEDMKRKSLHERLRFWKRRVVTSVKKILEVQGLLTLS
jgi:hypothetical protein